MSFFSWFWHYQRRGFAYANATVYGDRNDVQIISGAVQDSFTFAGSAVNVDVTLEVLEKQGSKSLNFVTPATVTVPAGTAEVMIQKIGTGDIRVGGTAGLKIEAGNDFRLNFVGDLEIAGSSTVVVARLSWI